jgi:predicted amidohydrolase
MIDLLGYPANWWDELRDFLTVGIVQTNVNASVAWTGSGTHPFSMSRAYQIRSWNQVRQSLKAFSDGEEHADVVLFPELSIPRARIADVRILSTRINSLIVAGCDYSVDYRRKTIGNKAVVFVPHSWSRGSSRKSKIADQYFVGKTYAAPVEVSNISKAGYTFSPEPNIYVFSTRNFGFFGVCICYDLLDLERVLMYKGVITHLFVLAYNRDISSFYQLAEATSRSAYCNVVICNTGFYGGSLATTVKYKPFERTVYRHEGANLFAIQSVRLPVRRMLEAQQGLIRNSAGEQEFKNRPPGYGARSAISGGIQIQLKY